MDCLNIHLSWFTFSKQVTNSNWFGALTSIDIVEDYEEEVKDDINSVFFNLSLSVEKYHGYQPLTLYLMSKKLLDHSTYHNYQSWIQRLVVYLINLCDSVEEVLYNIVLCAFWTFSSGLCSLLPMLRSSGTWPWYYFYLILF